MSRIVRISKSSSNELLVTPSRETEFSAGYDFMASEDILIPSAFSSAIKMLIDAYSQTSFVDAISKTTLGRLITKKKFDDSEIIQSALLEALPLIMSNRVLTLDQMKDLTKRTQTKLSLIPTGMKAYLDNDEYLQLSLRSSIPMSSYLMLANGVGIIDSDYVDNPANEGHIFFQVINLSPFDIQIKKGDKIGQGVILNYRTVENDIPGKKRVGGFGSTTVKQ